MEFNKYPKIYRIGKEEVEGLLEDPEYDIVIQEKIDGGNFRFMITKDGKLVFGSRNRTIIDEEGKEEENIKHFRRCIEHVREKLPDDLNALKGLTFYGENCVRHTIPYDWDKMPVFLGYDISGMKHGWMSYPNNEKLFEEIGLDFVPVIKVVKAKEIKELTDKDVPKSKYYEGKAEGIMLKNYSNGVFSKYVIEGFQELNKDAFGKKKRDIADDTELIVYKYCPNIRIDKQIFKLIDEGHKLEMAMMRELPRAVIKDILDEEGKDILFSNYTINFQRLKKLISNRCRSVLNQVITNTALNREVRK